MRTRSQQARTCSQASRQKRLHFPACSGLEDRIGLPGMKGNFVGPPPSRARGRQKWPSLLPIITSRSRVSRVEILVRRCQSFNSVRRQKGGQKEADLRGSSLGRYAVPPPLTPGLKSGIHLIAGRLLGTQQRAACERKTTPPR